MGFQSDIYTKHLESMPRLSDWTKRLDAFLIENRARPFEWGTFDCCMFAGQAIASMTGVDPAAPFRDTYGNVAEASDVMMRTCGSRAIGDMASHVFSAAGFAECSPHFARRGDPVLVEQNGERLLGILGLDGTTVWIVGQTVDGKQQGLGFVFRASIVKAWRVD